MTVQGGSISRYVRMPRGAGIYETIPAPRTTIVCHGDAGKANDDQFVARLRASTLPIERVIFVESAEAIAAVRAEMELRGDRYLALVDTRCVLHDGWLDDLVREVEWGPAIGAAAFVPELAREGGIFTADARCTLLSLSKYPAHERLASFESLDGAIADFLIRALSYRVATRCAGSGCGHIPAARQDGTFEAARGMTLPQALSSDPELIERALRAASGRRAGLVSIVMLSWNAPEFTKMALESIRSHTRGDYEIIIVDNGSRAETVSGCVRSRA